MLSLVIKSQWRTDEYWPSYDGRYVLLRQYSEDSHDSGELFHGYNRRQDFYAVYDTLEKYPPTVFNTIISIRNY